MPRVLLYFDHRHFGYSIQFGSVDRRPSALGRVYRVTDEAALRDFVKRCNIEDLEDFETSLRAWGRGSNYVQLTDEQYATLK